MITPRLVVLAASVLLSLPIQAQSNWKKLAPPTSPPVRELQAMAFDLVQQGVVLFGGWDSSGNMGDTWLWNGANWTKPNLTTSPPARHMAAMTSFRIGVLLFGGDGGGSDTWEWSVGKWNLRKPTTNPGARSGHSMAYDVSRQRAVLFGGLAGSAVLGDTWEWNGTNWTKLSPTASPIPRMSHRMAYDIVRKRIVLFGGRDSSRNMLGDTWEFDGTNWTKRSPKTSPSARWFSAMSYDALRGRTVLYGGDSSGTRQSDTWEWDGTDWLLRKPTTSPGARRYHVVAYDERREQIVLFGGDAGGRQQDTWVYGTPNAARYAKLGTGCAGNAGVPALAALQGDLPWTGSTFRVRVSNLPASAPALMVLGISKTVWGTNKLPLDLTSMGMPGCTLYASLDLLTPLANSGGSAVWTVQLPSLGSLVGIPFYNQGIVDAPGKNALGVVMSNAAEGKVGAR